MLLSELIVLLESAMDQFDDLNVLLEDYEVGNLMDLHSVRLIEYEGDEYVLLSDRVDNKSIEVNYLN